MLKVLNSDSKESIHLIGHALDVLDKLDEKVTDKIDKMKKLSIPMVVCSNGYGVRRRSKRRCVSVMGERVF